MSTVSPPLPPRPISVWWLGAKCLPAVTDRIVAHEGVADVTTPSLVHSGGGRIPTNAVGEKRAAGGTACCCPRPLDPGAGTGDAGRRGEPVARAAPAAGPAADRRRGAVSREPCRRARGLGGDQHLRRVGDRAGTRLSGPRRRRRESRDEGTKRRGMVRQQGVLVREAGLRRRAVVRGRRLDSLGRVRFEGGSALRPRELRIRGREVRSWSGHRPDGSRGVPSGVSVRASGCYGVQIDGTRFSRAVVFTATTP